MAEKTKGRVEMKLGHAGYGTFGTQERIDALREQSRQHERMTRPPPTQAFAQVLQEKTVPTLKSTTEPKIEVRPPAETMRTIKHPTRPGRRGPIRG